MATTSLFSYRTQTDRAHKYVFLFVDHPFDIMSHSFSRNNNIVGPRNLNAFSRVNGRSKRQDKKTSSTLGWRGGSKFPSPNGIVGGSSNEGGDDGISLELFKVALSLFLAALNVGCWRLPMCIKQLQESKTLGLANAFSGGVFLSLAFGHMIPHAHKDLAKSGYPLSASLYLALGGYLLIFWVEKVMFDTHDLMYSDESSSAETVSKDAAIMNKRRGKGGGNGKSGFVLLAALGIHSAFETMALGLSDTKVGLIHHHIYCILSCIST